MSELKKPRCPGLAGMIFARLRCHATLGNAYGYAAMIAGSGCKPCVYLIEKNLLDPMANIIIDLFCAMMF